MDEENVVLDDGILFAVYETGPWVGFKLAGNPSMGWVKGGTAQYDFMVSMLKSKNY